MELFLMLAYIMPFFTVIQFPSLESRRSVGGHRWNSTRISLAEGIPLNSNYRSTGNEIADESRVTNWQKRRKRIIWGTGLLSMDSYPVAKYQGSMTDPFFCKHRLLKAIYQSPEKALELAKNIRGIKSATEKYFKEVMRACSYQTHNRNICGVVVLTNRVVQTSCHCIARPQIKWDSSTFVSMRVYNNFEDMKLVHVNFITWDDYQVPYISARYIVHEKCSQLYDRFMSYDFGLIYLKYPMETTALAPLFPMADVKSQWEYIVGKELVCLYVGWGAQKISQYGPHDYTTTFLQHTWRVTINYLDCYWLHYLYPIFIKLFKDTPHKYEDTVTWSCSEYFGLYRGVLANGDSGSPITCLDNIYFGMHMWQSDEGYNVTRAYSRTFSGESTIVFTPFENSAEYRKSFVANAENLLKQRDYATRSPNIPVPGIALYGAEIPVQGAAMQTSYATLVILSAAVFPLLTFFCYPKTHF